MADPNVTAIVVTYDRPDELRQAVDALLKQTRLPERIIVFDNGGQAKARMVLTDQLTNNGDRLQVVQSEQNLGGAGGFARGLALGLARGADWVWLLDDDAIADPKALEQLLAAPAAIAADTGALCCSVREFGRWARRHRRRFKTTSGREQQVSAREYASAQTEIDTGSFVGFLVSAKAARSVGLPEARFFLGYDDTDYSLRLREAGWRLWLIPGSVVFHLRSVRSRLRSSQFSAKHWYNIRNRLIVKRRYSRSSILPTLDGLIYGITLWLVTMGWTRATSWPAIWRALADGVAGKLDYVAGAPKPAPRKRPCFPYRARGAVIIRTQGRRPALLAEALESVAAQSLPMTPLVVVHGAEATFRAVSEELGERFPDMGLLHASDTNRMRGYPLNLALERLYDEEEGADFLFFLDDDDIVYPEFASSLTAVMRRQDADVVFAASNRRLRTGVSERAYTPMPASCLLVENFVPNNSYIIRLESIRSARPLFDESLEVLEDWNFLHQLLALHLKFSPLGEPLSEFRITGDGNTPEKQDQRIWDRAWDRVHDHLEEIIPTLERRYVIASLQGFDFTLRPPLSAPELDLLRRTEELVEAQFPDRVAP